MTKSLLPIMIFLLRCILPAMMVLPKCLLHIRIIHIHQGKSAQREVLFCTIRKLLMLLGGLVGIFVPSEALAARMTHCIVGGVFSHPLFSWSASCCDKTTGWRSLGYLVASWCQWGPMSVLDVPVRKRWVQVRGSWSGVFPPLDPLTCKLVSAKQ